MTRYKILKYQEGNKDSYLSMIIKDGKLTLDFKENPKVPVSFTKGETAQEVLTYFISTYPYDFFKVVAFGNNTLSIKPDKKYIIQKHHAEDNSVAYLTTDSNVSVTLDAYYIIDTKYFITDIIHSATRFSKKEALHIRNYLYKIYKADEDLNSWVITEAPPYPPIN